MKGKKILFASLLAAVAITATGCNGQTDSKQGITEDKIYIGNTAATSGAYSAVGQPFNIGLNASLKVYNDAGGFGGKTVELKHYDDGFDATQGLTYTEKLVEEDQVFALVGHFGTPTVGATVDYIQEKGIPMVYAATGVSALYNAEAKGNEKAVMSVQPIYNAEGAVLLARAAASTEGNKGLGGKKIGVISTTDEAGTGLLAGIQEQAEKLPKELRDNMKFVTTDAKSGTNHATAVTALKNHGCDVVIIAANQAPFEEILGYFNTTGYDNVKTITSYVSANTALAAKLYASKVLSETRTAYTTAWLDITSSSYVFKPAADDTVGNLIWSGYLALSPVLYANGVPGFSEEYWDAARAIFAYACTDPTNLDIYQNAFQMSFNSYALAGYIAGETFLTGLKRVSESEKDLSWKTYIAAMEDGKVDIPMGGEVDFSNGQRKGIQDLALNKMGPGLLGTGELEVYSPITSIDSVMEAVK